jgi:hypothetical protein
MHCARLDAGANRITDDKRIMRPGPNNNNKRPRGRGRGGKPHHYSGGGGGGGGSGGGGGGGGGGQPQHFNINRTIDSNGPDIKIRGNAHHIYEKYLQLARDSNSQGDRVMAENYLQHAEHYYRMIMAAQAAMPQQPPMQNQGNPNNPGQLNANGQPYPQQQHGGGNGQYRPQPNGMGPQPSLDGGGDGAQSSGNDGEDSAEEQRFNN